MLRRWPAAKPNWRCSSRTIHAVAGVDFVPLPPEFARAVTFSAGLPPAASVAASTLLGFLSGQEAAAIVAAAGMQPAAGL